MSEHEYISDMVKNWLRSKGHAENLERQLATARDQQTIEGDKLGRLLVPKDVPFSIEYARGHWSWPQRERSA